MLVLVVAVLYGIGSFTLRVMGAYLVPVGSVCMLYITDIVGGP